MDFGNQKHDADSNRDSFQVVIQGNSCTININKTTNKKITVPRCRRSATWNVRKMYESGKGNAENESRNNGHKQDSLVQFRTL